MHDLSIWESRSRDVPRPGGSLPYGIQHLTEHFHLLWSDRQQHGVWGTRPARVIGGTIRRVTPGLQGSLAALYASRHLRNASAVLSVFENVGLGFGRFQARSLSRYKSIPHVMISCWLAEDCTLMTAGQLRSVQRSVEQVSNVVVFSGNQVPILQDFLALDRARIDVVPFGVDTEYYSPSPRMRESYGPRVLAVGGDNRRDYATLVEAARISGIPLTLVCHPRNIAALTLPANIRVLYNIGHEAYRDLLQSADLVVTPTVAPRYPSGQSVVLEAMSMGRATLTTDSPAMREYVRPGIDGMLMPPRDAQVMAQMIEDLLKQDALRQSLGEAAARIVRERFSLEVLWSQISEVLFRAMGAEPRC